MGRQFRFYLLPSDIERVMAVLRSELHVKLIAHRSTTMKAVELESPCSESYSQHSKTTVVHVNCYIAAARESEIKLQYSHTLGQWLVDQRSEVIEFSGCDYDGSVLRIGRFYYQHDQLIGDSIWAKREEFVRWAERVFRRTKKMLTYSKTLMAYWGQDAEAWHRKGGRLKTL